MIIQPQNNDNLQTFQEQNGNLNLQNKVLMYFLLGVMFIFRIIAGIAAGISFYMIISISILSILPSDDPTSIDGLIVLLMIIGLVVMMPITAGIYGLSLIPQFVLKRRYKNYNLKNLHILSIILLIVAYVITAAYLLIFNFIVSSP